MDPRLAFEERVKAWVRAHRWKAATMYAAAVATPCALFILDAPRDLVPVYLAAGGVLTVATFAFWAILGKRIASRPPASTYDAGRRIRILVLVLVACTFVGIGLGILGDRLSR